MIKDYYRPKTISEALELFKKGTDFVPLAGGSVLSQTDKDISVVDLQDLELSNISFGNNQLKIGATTTLQTIFDHQKVTENFRLALNIEASRNIREQATIGGLLCTADGRSTLLSILLALDTEVSWEPGGRNIKIGDWLPLRGKTEVGKLITHLTIDTRIKWNFENIARSPLDVPIICAVVAKWSSTRLRVVIGGFGSSPLVIFDGLTSDDFATAITSSLLDSTDQWATAEYRTQVAKILVTRLMNDLQDNSYDEN